MIFCKCVVFLVACLALEWSEATLESLQSYYNQSSITTCVAVPVSDETHDDIFTIEVVPKNPHSNLTQLEEPNSIPSKSNLSITTKYNSLLRNAKPAAAEVEVRVTQQLIVVQYYASVKENSKALFFVGESQIGPQYLQQGFHKLRIEEIVHNKKLWLEVWWDDHQMYFEANMNRPIWSDRYQPSYINILGPPGFQVPENSVCDDVLNAMAMTSGEMPYQLAVVASAIMGVLVLLSAAASLLARRYWRSDSLPIAGHKDTPGRVHNYIAGFDQSYSGDSTDENFQYKPIEASQSNELSE